MFTLHVAIPAMDEADWLPSTMAALLAQHCRYPFRIYVCVNQPEAYRTDGREAVCLHNEETLRYLQSLCPCRVSVIDRCSRGQGWTGKKHGVGQARKELFDGILQQASADDVIVSLDADTLVLPDYLQSIADNFESHRRLADKGLQPPLMAIAVPYYHQPSGDEATDRAMLRYEIYMRHYLLQLLRIASPYAFTALGSAIAVRCSALKAIGGITPMQSGEDFYLLQKICKAGMKWADGRMQSPITLWNSRTVEPATRLSARVPFGTGPAIAKGRLGDWSSYPLYAPGGFDTIEAAYRLIPELYEGKHPENDFLVFLEEQYKDSRLWEPLRANHKDLPHFAKAFHEKADGLRILQFLKNRGETLPEPEDLSSERERLFKEEQEARQLFETRR